MFPSVVKSFERDDYKSMKSQWVIRKSARDYVLLCRSTSSLRHCDHWRHASPYAWLRVQVEMCISIHVQSHVRKYMHANLGQLRLSSLLLYSGSLLVFPSALSFVLSLSRTFFPTIIPSFFIFLSLTVNSLFVPPPPFPFQSSFFALAFLFLTFLSFSLPSLLFPPPFFILLARFSLTLIFFFFLSLKLYFYSLSFFFFFIYSSKLFLILFLLCSLLFVSITSHLSFFLSVSIRAIVLSVV